ncbi:AlkA N-terminal domain-containing protein [Blastopirellula retiformator]|uniref:DNA-3-methyladenine glycosylase II n=1 Tax=Blastopirellula retiformator TaxID=2527970 RepID=A0A5C5V6V1_9BACT|nr:AlkA N-terminal domain-containing protein [Blastopirellula retiformator]TWT34298.1 DNA-3-methyladenine glycosylase 2 [Blastopirellula retiformator]
MELNAEACYRAVLARDERHDGRFFTCVRTTQIYCRPVCPAVPPKRENCWFASLAAAAQEAGYRPCLRCRPEKAPQFWNEGATQVVAQGLRWIEEGALDVENVAALAERLGIGERQLRRLFQQELGASPIAVAQTRRVLLALQLLQQTNLSMIDVALAAGFQSLRRFNEAFQKLYDRPPAKLRRQHRQAAGPGSQLSLSLPYRPPYDWPSILRFLEQRAITGVEQVEGASYARAIELDGAVGTLHVADAPDEAALQVTIRFPQLKSLPQIIARIRRMFDLNADIGAIGGVLSQDPRLAPLIEARPGLRIPGAWDGFEIAVRAILGQQITVQAARSLASRLVSKLGVPLEGEGPAGLTHRFPPPERFDQQTIESLGMPRARAAAIVDLATRLSAEPQLLETIGQRANAIEALCELRGIGPWTAHYIAMRVLRDSDAFLAADVGLQRVMAVDGVRPTAKRLLAWAENWRPWRAYAVMHLWTSESSSLESSHPQEVPNATAT